MLLRLYIESCKSMFKRQPLYKATLPLIPPENPLQLAKMKRGRPSLFMSKMLWAVLKAESGYHTWPA